jgi:hypothetical protein
MKRKIEEYYNNLKNFLENVIKFRKELTNYVPFDAMKSLEFFNKGLKIQVEYMKKHGHTADNEKNIHEMEIAISYMDRIFEDSFIEELEEEKNIKLIDLNDKERDKFIKELIQREEDVWDGLFKIIRGNFEDRGIVCWWD